MASEGEFPKSDGDILYGSEANNNESYTCICESMIQNSINTADASLTDITYTYGDSDAMSDATGYNDTINTGQTNCIFVTDRYFAQESSSDESNLSEVTEWDDVFDLKKTLTLANAKYVPEVTDEIKQSSGGTAECYMEFTYEDATTANSTTQTTASSSYVAKTYTNPNPEKLVTIVKVYLRHTHDQPDTFAYEDTTVVEAYDFIDGVIQTESKTFDSNIKSIFVSAKAVYNGASAITVDVSTDGGSTWDATGEPLNEWITLDGDDTDVVIIFNMDVDGTDSPELFGYAYKVTI